MSRHNPAPPPDPSDNSLELIISTRNIAKRLGIKPVRCWRWIERGFLPAFQLPSGEWATTPAMINAALLAQYGEYMQKAPERKAARKAKAAKRQGKRNGEACYRERDA